MLERRYNEAMFWLVGGILTTQLLILLFIGYIFVKVRRFSWDISDLVSDWVRPQGDKPSKLVEFIDAMGQMVASRLVSSAEAAIRGSAGGAARAEHQVELANNPMLAMMGGKLGKNPLVGAIMQAVLNKFGNKEQGSLVPSSNGSAPKFKLWG